jgi:hypothetical protein
MTAARPRPRPGGPSPRRSLPRLEQVRFGEFLRDRALITDEQWLAALADHWSSPVRRTIGATIVAHGYLSAEVVEAEARMFHHGLDIVDVVDVIEIAPIHRRR